MYTRCTACHTTHPVNASLLARAGGKYRCGKCQKVGNALDALFDQWPGAGEIPPASGDIPILGMSIDLERARESRLEPDGSGLSSDREDHPGGPANSRSRLARYSWILITAGLALVIAFELAEFRDSSLAESRWVTSAMTRLGLREPQVYQDLDLVQLVNRELRSDPSRPGMLQLRATIVNRAEQAQPFPDLEVVLLDAAGSQVGLARFTPIEYLAENTSGKGGMTPGAFLPLTLAIPDPGSNAVGFELNFR